MAEKNIEPGVEKRIKLPNNRYKKVPRRPVQDEAYHTETEQEDIDEFDGKPFSRVFELAFFDP